jgi:endonuclease III
MARPSPQEITRAVLDRYPRTYGEDLGIRSPGSPSGLFRTLVMALLMGARIRADIAAEAARALFQKRWNSPQAMVDAGWDGRAQTLNQAGYARYDERTSTMLGDTSQQILDQYRGDLRRLRKEAGNDPGDQRRLLQEFPGMGRISVDIFFREVQRAWEELYPFADKKALGAARRLGLGEDARALTRLAEGDDYARLVSGLVRTDLDKAYDEVTEAASRS